MDGGGVVRAERRPEQHVNLCHGLLGWRGGDTGHSHIVFPERRRLKRRKGVYFRRRLWRQVAAYRDGLISLEQLTASVQGWVNHTRYGNTTGLRKALLTSVVIPPVRKGTDV